MVEKQLAIEAGEGVGRWRGAFGEEQMSMDTNEHFHTNFLTHIFLVNIAQKVNSNVENIYDILAILLLQEARH